MRPDGNPNATVHSFYLVNEPMSSAHGMLNIGLYVDGNELSGWSLNMLRSPRGMREVARILLAAANDEDDRYAKRQR